MAKLIPPDFTHMLPVEMSADRCKLSEWGFASYIPDTKALFILLWSRYLYPGAYRQSVAQLLAKTPGLVYLCGQFRPR